MKTLRARFAALLGPLLSVVAIASACGPTSAEPSATASPRVEAPTAAASATASPTITPQGGVPAATVVPSEQATAGLAAVEQAVVRLRGVGVESPVTRTFVTDAGMRAVLDEELDDPEVRRVIQNEGVLLEALGLLPEGTDLFEAYKGLLGDQVLGLYSPDDKALYVLANAELGALELSTYVHEYHHALQDQRFNLDEIDRSDENRDAAMAASTLIEGDALYTQTQYVAHELGPAGAFAMLASASAARPPAGPQVLLDLLQFPYLQGLNFVQALARRDNASYAGIDAAFGRVPLSTEQVMHPEKYFVNEAPVEVVAPGPLPAGWTDFGNDVVGEYLLRRWLSNTGIQQAAAVAAAQGWGGDRFLLGRSAEGRPGVAIRVAWDNAAEADEFLASVAPGPPAAGVRVLEAGRNWVGVWRINATTVGMTASPDRAAAEDLARTVSAG